MKINPRFDPEMISLPEILSTYKITGELFETEILKYENDIPSEMIKETQNGELFIHKNIVEILFGNKDKTLSTNNERENEKKSHLFNFKYRVNVYIRVEEDEEDDDSDDEISKRLKNLNQ